MLFQTLKKVLKLSTSRILCGTDSFTKIWTWIIKSRLRTLISAYSQCDNFDRRGSSTPGCEKSFIFDTPNLIFNLLYISKQHSNNRVIYKNSRMINNENDLIFHHSHPLVQFLSKPNLLLIRFRLIYYCNLLTKKTYLYFSSHHKYLGFYCTENKYRRKTLGVFQQSKYTNGNVKNYYF